MSRKRPFLSAPVVSLTSWLHHRCAGVPVINRADTINRSLRLRFEILGSRFGDRGLGFGVRGSGFGVRGVGFRVLGLKFGTGGSRFRIKGFGHRV